MSSWVRPAGFQEADVASSARPIKALPIAAALAPEPTGIGEDEIMTGKGAISAWVEDISNKIKLSNDKKKIILQNLENTFFIALILTPYKPKSFF